jgi:hypothetical protein
MRFPAQNGRRLPAVAVPLDRKRCNLYNLCREPSDVLSGTVSESVFCDASSSLATTSSLAGM